MHLILFTDFIIIAVQDLAGRTHYHCFPNLAKTEEQRENKYYFKKRGVLTEAMPC